MTDIQDLIAKKELIEREIRSMRAAQRLEALTQIRNLMIDNGISLADLGSQQARAPSKGRDMSNRVPAPVKYRDVLTGKTWSGRGLQPNWLKELLAVGKKIEDFRVR